ncbi:uncharacterized protein LOC125190114 isoform X2 [Salvia hispanica]|uniref:uncharacterized protein LOC125190114 isoform X2 n=1 Tax=Salvia hispanica TaxID=49212 RepID=UPI00200905C0|nr:uncharacterized protein LOC125190114 isoform X2 [Salvia hispanica]
MAGNGLPTLGRVKLVDLIPSEGIPSDSYKLSVSTLSQSLAQYSAAIIQFPMNFGALLRSCLESSRLYFHHKPSFPSADSIQHSESREWCKTSGYRADPHMWQEIYDFRPGLTSTEPVSVCCHGRPSFQGAQHHNLTAQEDGQIVMFSDHDYQVDRSLLTLLKSDKAGLYIRDLHGHWVLVDGDLGPQEAIVYPGLALYQATAGYINPAMYRTDISNLQGSIYGRCTLAFKLMPKSMASLNCSEMRAAGHGVEAQFQLPVPVDDFMQRSTDQLLSRNSFATFGFPAAQEGSIKPIMQRKKNNLRCKPLPPSKRLRLEAQRVLKERVQDIADKKGIKLRFCTLKECEGHINSIDSPCANVRMEIGWPPGVPFVHPHDLPNKAKIGFLETYEPGWSETNDIE